MDARDLYRRWLLELWHGDLGVGEEILAEDVVARWPDREVRGRAALVDVIAQTRGMFSALAFTLEQGPVVDGDLLAARWAGRGETPGGPLAFLGHDLMRLRDGRIAEYWVVSWPGT